MKITRIRNRHDGVKLSSLELQDLVHELGYALHAAGFITNVSISSSSSINIGLHMRSFSIDTSKLGYNAVIYFGSYGQTFKNGYKRTNVPTWKQRVQFNNIVNRALTTQDVSARVVSGSFIVRDGTKRYTERDWYNQVPEYLSGFTTDYSVNGLRKPISVRMTEKQAKQFVKRGA